MAKPSIDSRITVMSEKMAVMWKRVVRLLTEAMTVVVAVAEKMYKCNRYSILY